jgi:hypothetical protein
MHRKHGLSNTDICQSLITVLRLYNPPCHCEDSELGEEDEAISGFRNSLFEIRILS